MSRYFEFLRVSAVFEETLFLRRTRKKTNKAVNFIIRDTTPFCRTVANGRLEQLEEFRVGDDRDTLISVRVLWRRGVLTGVPG